MGRPKKIESTFLQESVPAEPQVDENLLALREKLKELNIAFNETDDFITLVNLLSSNAQSKKTNNVLTYASKTYLKNKDLINRCYKLGISEFYLSPIIDEKKPDIPVHLFTDNDSVLDDAQLLEKVRFCKFSPVDFQAVMSSYAKQPRAQRMR